MSANAKPVLISVVTITRNNVNEFCRTAASVLSQTYTDFEWIVIDGGSTDGTVERLRALARQPDYWVSESDEGIYDAHNKGVARATGEYVICLNSGDLFHGDDVLARIASSHPTADVVYGDWMRVYRHHRTSCAAPATLPPFYFFMPKCNICHQAMFVRTRLLRDSPFDTRYHALADLAKWRQFTMAGRSFRHVPVTVCDFDAVDGASVRLDERLESDMRRLRGEWPAGLWDQTAQLSAALERHAVGERLWTFWRCVTWFPRKAWGAAKCLEEHGWRYTLAHVAMLFPRMGAAARNVVPGKVEGGGPAADSPRDL